MWHTACLEVTVTHRPSEILVWNRPPVQGGLELNDIHVSVEFIMMNLVDWVISALPLYKGYNVSCQRIF
jgi:hypothetical protein